MTRIDAVLTVANAVDKLDALIAASDEAERVMMTGAEADSCTIRGQEGVNYIAWCKAADAERAHREAHGWGYSNTGVRNYHPRKGS